MSRRYFDQYDEMGEPRSILNGLPRSPNAAPRPEHDFASEAEALVEQDCKEDLRRIRMVENGEVDESGRPLPQARVAA